MKRETVHCVAQDFSSSTFSKSQQMQRCLLIGLATDVTAREREFESRHLANRFYKLKALLDEGDEGNISSQGIYLDSCPETLQR
jgi:hypothetical protein